MVILGTSLGKCDFPKIFLERVRIPQLKYYKMFPRVARDVNLDGINIILFVARSGFKNFSRAARDVMLGGTSKTPEGRRRP